MRVLSVLTEPPLVPLPAFGSTPGRPVDAAKASCLPGPRGCALGFLYARLGLTAHTQPGPHQQKPPRRDGVGAAASPPEGIGRVGSESAWHWGLLLPSWPSAGHQQRPKKSARRRRRAPADDSSRRPRRALPRRGCLWWVQSQGQRQWHCWLTTRRHKNRSTAAATTAHVVHRSLHCTHHR